MNRMSAAVDALSSPKQYEPRTSNAGRSTLNRPSGARWMRSQRGSVLAGAERKEEVIGSRKHPSRARLRSIANVSGSIVAVPRLMLPSLLPLGGPRHEPRDTPVGASAVTPKAAIEGH